MWASCAACVDASEFAKAICSHHHDLPLVVKNCCRSQRLCTWLPVSSPFGRVERVGCHWQSPVPVPVLAPVAPAVAPDFLGPMGCGRASIGPARPEQRWRPCLLAHASRSPCHGNQFRAVCNCNCQLEVHLMTKFGQEFENFLLEGDSLLSSANISKTVAFLVPFLW